MESFNKERANVFNRALSLLVLVMLLGTSAQAAKKSLKPDVIAWEAPPPVFVASVFSALDLPPYPKLVEFHVDKVTSSEDFMDRIRVFTSLAFNGEAQEDYGPKKYTVYYVRKENGNDWSFSSSPNTNASRIRYSGPHSFGYAKALVAGLEVWETNK